jgi:uncharacterized protein involved in outer membrane biogenesis
VNHFLTGLGILLILALAAALGAPLFVDWSAYRQDFEHEAARIVGVPVRVAGPVAVRLLPSPHIRFADVEIGQEGSPARFHAAHLSLDVALMPLLRGDVHVTDLLIDGARLSARLSDDGRVALPLDPAAADPRYRGGVALEHVAVVDSRLDLADADGAPLVTLSGLTFAGEATSLSGPIKLEGSASDAGALYRFRLTTGSFDQNGAGRLKFALTPADGGTALDLDGLLTLGDGAPRYEGAAVLAPAPPPATAPAADGWRLEAQVKADPRRVVAENVALQSGAEDRALRLGGTAELRLGRAPSATLVLSARQLDLDRALGIAKDAAAAPPVQSIAALAQAFPQLAAPPIPIHAGVSIESVVLGGDIGQKAEADIATTGDATWTIERMSVRLPGATNLRGAGTLDLSSGHAAFSGQAALDTADLPGLVDWLDGPEHDGRRDTLVRRLTLAGRLDLQPGHYAVEGLKLTADGEALTGSAAWSEDSAGRPQADGRQAQLTADLASDRLDLDRLDPGRLARILGISDPSPATTRFDLKLAAGHLVFGGVAAAGVDIDATLAAGSVDLRRLRIADLGGVKVDGHGALDLAAGARHGRIEGHFEAADAAPLTALVNALPLDPGLRAGLARRAGHLLPAKLDLSLGTAGIRGEALSGSLTGTLGGTSVAVTAAAPRLALDAPIELGLTGDNPDSAGLLSQLGLEAGGFADNGGPAHVELALAGAPSDEARLTATLSAAGTRVTLDGSTQGLGGAKPRLGGTLAVTSDDAGRLLVVLDRAPPLTLPRIPAEATAQLGWSPDGLSLQDFKAQVAGRTVTGHIDYGASGAVGDLRVDRLGLDALWAMAVGPAGLALPASSAPHPDSVWPAQAFSQGMLAGLSGRIGLQAGTLALGHGLELRDAGLTLGIGRGEIALDPITGTLAGGRARAGLTIRRAGGDTLVALRGGVAGMALGDLGWRPAGQPVATGKLDVTFDLQGGGHSLADVVAALAGNGSVTLGGLRVAGFDPQSFGRIIAAAETLDPVTQAKVQPIAEAALAGGDFVPADTVSAAFTVASGVGRIGNLAASSADAAATASAALDLASMTLTAEATLAPRAPPPGGEGTPQLALRFSGPLATPARQLDVTVLANYLTARALDREVKHIEALEAERRARDAKREEERRAAEEARRQAEAERARVAAAEAEAKRQAEAQAQAAAALPPLDPPREIGPTPGADRTPIGRPQMILPRPLDPFAGGPIPVAPEAASARAR